MNFSIQVPILSPSLNYGDKLPTIKNLIQLYEYIRKEKLKTNLFEPPESEILDEAIHTLKKVWDKIIVSLIKNQLIKQKLDVCLKEYRKQNKRFKVYSHKVAVRNSVNKYL